MKIIQLVTAVNGESPGHFESQLLGLGDDGGLYEYVMECRATGRFNAVYKTPEEVAILQKLDKDVVFQDGTTQGWRLICMSIDRPKVIPHPLDPTRAERS